jgi:hypothetical protein
MVKNLVYGIWSHIPQWGIGLYGCFLKWRTPKSMVPRWFKNQILPAIEVPPFGETSIVVYVPWPMGLMRSGHPAIETLLDRRPSQAATFWSKALGAVGIPSLAKCPKLSSLTCPSILFDSQRCHSFKHNSILNSHFDGYPSFCWLNHVETVSTTIRPLFRRRSNPTSVPPRNAVASASIWAGLRGTATPGCDAVWQIENRIDLS